MIDDYFKQVKITNSISEKTLLWLKSHKEIHEDINNVLLGFNELPFAIQIFGGVGDNFTTIHPWHHLFFEAEQDLDSAILLLIMGFYKDSFRSMRSFLELYIFALFNFVNEDSNNFQNWLQGKIYTPRLSNLLKTIFKKNADLQTLNERLNWGNEIESVYNELSAFIHTRGALHTHTSIRNSNRTVFSDAGIETGVSFLLRSVRLAAMGFVVNFPMSFHGLPLFEKFAFNWPAGGFLNERQVEKVKAIFTEDICSQLSAICLLNEDAKSLAEGVRSMPDVTEEEVFESLHKIIESEEFVEIKPEIVRMIKDGEVGEAFALVGATQKAVIRTVTSILFNPFYEPISKKTL